MVQGKRESGCGRLQQQLAVVAVAAGRLFFLSGMIRPVALDRSHCCRVL
jgi:hypothetical protein